MSVMFVFSSQSVGLVWRSASELFWGSFFICLFFTPRTPQSANLQVKGNVWMCVWRWAEHLWGQPVKGCSRLRLGVGSFIAPKGSQGACTLIKRKLVEVTAACQASRSESAWRVRACSFTEQLQAGWGPAHLLNNYRQIEIAAGRTPQHHPNALRKGRQKGRGRGCKSCLDPAADKEHWATAMGGSINDMPVTWQLLTGKRRRKTLEVVIVC